MGIKPLKLIVECPTRWPSAYDMLDRAIYLQAAITTFTTAENVELSLSPVEWDQAKFLRDLLYPFKACNERIEATTRPGIHKVFPVYETLFNELDRISTVLQDPNHSDHKWMAAVYPAVVEMKIKLKRYYAKTEHPSAYGNSIILNPKWKLTLFQQESWEEGSVDRYRTQCRQAYLDNYHHRSTTMSKIMDSTKRPWDHFRWDDEDSSDDDDHIRRTLHSQDPEPYNEFDHYIMNPVNNRAGNTLAYWRSEATSFPKLALMARDYLAVSATGAGVESQFSRSGQVMRPSRGALLATTVSDIMTYTDHLKREKKGLKKSESAGMTIAEGIALDMEVDSSDYGTGNVVPQDWQDQWWNDRGHRFSSRNSFL